jgi:hypothetical protein
MLETSIQYTCDGCGETEVYFQTNVTKATVREALKLTYGWRFYGKLDYCKKCVENGNAARRETDMNH